MKPITPLVIVYCDNEFAAMHSLIVSGSLDKAAGLSPIPLCLMLLIYLGMFHIGSVMELLETSLHLIHLE